MIKTAIALLIVRAALLSFEYSESGPSAPFPYYSASSDELPLGNLSNPAYLPLWKTYYFNADYARPYMLDGIEAWNMRAGWGHDGFAVQSGWSRFGIEGYSEDVFTGSLGYMPWSFLSAGAGVSYYHIDINTDELDFSYGRPDVSVSLLAIPLEWLSASFTYLNSCTAIKNENMDLIYPGWSGGVSVKPAPGITFTWNLYKSYFDYINTYSVSANLLEILNLRAGYSRETSSYSASVIFIYGNLMVSYGMNYHSYLGMTHRFGITLTADPRPFEQVNYIERLTRKKASGPAKKTDINRCTLEGLKESGIFSETIAERIIKYREIIGPVNRDALVKIGVPSGELKEICEKLTGFADDTGAGDGKPANKKTASGAGKNGKRISIDERKILFQKLLENRISASESLLIADLAKNKNIDDLISAVQKLEDIPDEKRRLIIKICSDTLLQQL